MLLLPESAENPGGIMGIKWVDIDDGKEKCSYWGMGEARGDSPLGFELESSTSDWFASSYCL